MSKFSFKLASSDPKRDLPGKLIIGRSETETLTHVVLKLLAYVYFYRDRILLEPNLHSPNIPFTPDVVQLDYELKPVLWVECGECAIVKLDKLAVKVPEAEIWILKKSFGAADELYIAMDKAGLRKKRYTIIGLDQMLLEEMTNLVSSRNELLWVKENDDPPQWEFDFNGLWFEMPIKIIRN